jgi:hypothetical protein
VLLGTYPKSKSTCSSFAHITPPHDFKTCTCMRESSVPWYTFSEFTRDDAPPPPPPVAGVPVGH